MSLPPGQVLNNRYRIVKLLGQGGFGAVYHAWDTTFELPCAIKENIEISPEAQRQFLREAKLLRTLRHPNLPQVTDYFVISGQGQYLVMDFVDGEDLQEKLDRIGGPLSETQVLAWIAQVCDALSYLHAQNPPVIHRDVKPGNIKITSEGKAVLVDFGIAKVFDPNLRTTMGARAVTSGYSPPEQYGRGITDAQSDIYALGATLYNLLTGQTPPDSVDLVTRNSPSPASALALNPAVSPAVSAAIEKAMFLERKERWNSVEAFKSALLPPITTSSIPVSVRGEAITVMSVGKTQIAQATRAPLASIHLYRFPPLFWIAAIFLGIWVVLALWRSPEKPIRYATQTSLEQATVTTIQNQSPILLPTSEYKLITELPTPAASLLPTTQAPMAKFITDSHNVKMAFILSGEFQMGSDIGSDDEKPVHTVYLDSFYTDVYEVTNARYAECVSAGECQPPVEIKSYTRNSYYDNPQYADFPVIYVNWNMANTYCEWRGSSLPTEAQWEKAARGGLEGKTYPWGDQAPSCQAEANNGAQFTDCRPIDTVKVGSFSPNGYGLFDMAGNVWEWVKDWYAKSYYSQSSLADPFGPASSNGRVVRGGSWGYTPNSLRVSYREMYVPSRTDDYFGFRCARSP